ncbi:MAG: peptidoglycan DD-metalloendopeptidase family protein [Bacilli bacterium]
MTLINLCNIPFLSTDYSDVVDFSNKNQRDSFFEGYVGKRLEGNIKTDGERTYLNINVPCETLINYDYCFFKDNNMKPWYYFITNIEKVTNNNSNIHLQLDVWSTYYFDFNIMESFVDRCHVPRWNGDTPTANNEEEGLFFGEIKQLSKTKLYDLKKSLIITSSTPMGYVPNFTPMGGGNSTEGESDSLGDTGSSGTMWKEGKMSSLCFRFQKGGEGFAPRQYRDSGGVLTIGYGTTPYDKEAWATLTANQPCSEEMAAKIFYNSANNNYGKPIVNTCLKLGIDSQGQFDALCSLAYNSGTGTITGSNRLMDAIAKNPKDESTIRSIWESFKIKDRKGNTLNGLIWRRKQECNMYFGKNVEIRAISKVGVGGTVTENNGNGWLPTDYTDETGGLNGHKSVSNEFGNDWLVPVTGATVSSLYGWRIHPTLGVRKFHSGIDLGCPTGTPILATKGGTIVQTGNSDTMGIYARQNCGNYQVIYMHMSKLSCKQGDNLKRGDKIGEVGSTGRSTGAHLHWQIQTVDGGTTTDPMPNAKKGDKV